MDRHTPPHRSTRKGSPERGAVLVEFALVTPLLIMLVFGAIEYGFFFKDYLTVANTTRSGARVGSAAGSSGDADYQILQSVKSAAAALPGGASSIQKISIYKSTAAAGLPSAQCQTASTNTGTDKCNVYTSTDFGLAPTKFGCGLNSVDSVWCPTTRSDSQATGTDYVGVWVKTTHGNLTSLFGSSKIITDKVVMRIEPRMP